MNYVWDEGDFILQEAILHYKYIRKIGWFGSGVLKIGVHPFNPVIQNYVLIFT